MSIITNIIILVESELGWEFNHYYSWCDSQTSRSLNME